MRGSKNNSRVENDSLENSPPEAAPVSYPFYPPGKLLVVVLKMSLLVLQLPYYPGAAI